MDQVIITQYQTFKPEELLPYIKNIQELGYSVNKWIKNNISLINELVELPENKTFDDFYNKNHQSLMLLKKNNIKTTSKFNFIVSLPNNYMLQIAGQRNRGWNLFNRKGYGEGQKHKETLPTNTFLTTYHTISRFVPYLLFTMMQKGSNPTFRHFSIPPTYLVHIPGKPQLISDDNYCVVQKCFEPGLRDVRANIRSLSKVPDLQFKELCYAIVKLGLWDIAGNLWLNKKGNFVVGDTEQYFWNKPENFFRCNEHAVIYEIFRGLAQVGAFYKVGHMPTSLAHMLYNHGYKDKSITLYNLVNRFINDNPMLSVLLQEAKKSSDYKNRFSKYFGQHPQEPKITLDLSTSEEQIPGYENYSSSIIASTSEEQIPGYENYSKFEMKIGNEQIPGG